MPNIPLTFADVTNEWLSEVLETDIDGFTSESAKASVSWVTSTELNSTASNETVLPSSVVVKLPPLSRKTGNKDCTGTFEAG